MSVGIWPALLFLGDIGWIAFAYMAWWVVRTGWLPWTARSEREALILACFRAIFLPVFGWGLITTPAFITALAFTSAGLSTYWFGRAWWKLHKDGPNNGRRRRQVKAAVKRLGNRLVVVPQPAPA